MQLAAVRIQEQRLALSVIWVSLSVGPAPGGLYMTLWAGDRKSRTSLS
jgi:hypothetical protein